MLSLHSGWVNSHVQTIRAFLHAVVGSLVYPTFHWLLNHHCMPENLKGCGPDLSIAIALTIDTNCTQWLLFPNDSFSLALRHPCFYSLNPLICLLPSQFV